MTKFKEKKFQPFALLKISANTLAAHYQAPQTNPQTNACQRAAIFPQHKKTKKIIFEIK